MSCTRVSELYLESQLRGFSFGPLELRRLFVFGFVCSRTVFR